MKGRTSLMSPMIEAGCVALLLSASWTLVARPMQSRLDRATAEVAKAQAEIDRAASVLESDPVDPAFAMTRVTDHALRLQRMCDLSSDTGHLYETIGELARQHELSIDRMDPKRITVAVSSGPKGSATKGTKAEKGQPTSPAVIGSGYSIEVSGAYGSIASFVESIEERTGLSKVMSFKLLPGRDLTRPDAVRATIETAHYRLSKPLIEASAKGIE